jgi:UDP-hydrolysing UDP-N-acetyl-D-glucosamine 2-epimerase
MATSSKKICIITASRSEYGTLRWLIDEVEQDEDLRLQLIATGGHVSQSQGYTVKEIEKDGYRIDEKIEMLLSSDTQESIVKSMGICSLAIGDAFKRLQPDIIIILGDRYELLPICSAALIMGIPIAHISGGDVTLGAIDDQIRNAVTMMSSIHFPSVQDSADRIKQMFSENKYIYTVGEPGLDNFRRLELYTREQLAKELDINISKKWILLTYHPETKISLESNMEVLKNILDEILDFDDFELVVTKANADYGGSQINNYLEEQANKRSFKLFTSLGQICYLSFMKEVFFVIGNSSSGIIEAPFLGKPVINVGSRQDGRHLCSNVKTVLGEKIFIRRVLYTLMNNSGSFIPDYYYGNGFTSSKIKDTIKEYLFNL